MAVGKHTMQSKVSWALSCLQNMSLIVLIDKAFLHKAFLHKIMWIANGGF